MRSLESIALVKILKRKFLIMCNCWCSMFVVIFWLPRLALCMDMKESEVYLKQFGYMNNCTMSAALGIFQKSAGIPPTGIMDDQTHAAMEMPRCGEALREEWKGPFQGSIWRAEDVNYRIVDYPPGLPRKTVDKTIARAFGEWSKVLGIRFTKKKFVADFDITFSYRPNVAGINSNIILAKGKFPANGGHVYFSADQKWTVGNEPGKHNLYHVALHEIGHSLGLLHSSYRQSIMSPFFEYNPNPHIHPSDKSRALKLYADIAAQELKEKPPTNVTRDTCSITYEEPPLCKLNNIDAIIAYAEDKLYVFRGEEYWRLDAWTKDRVFDERYPKRIADTWKNCPTSIDTAFVDFQNSKTYFFKGSKCWMYPDGSDTLAPGYPKSISEEFPGIPNDLDAATAVEDDIIYFIKGSQLWRFRINATPHISQEDPRPIADWRIPHQEVDAALYFHQYSEELYFFKDMLYYRYNENEDPKGRHIKLWWFNC